MTGLFFHISFIIVARWIQFIVLIFPKARSEAVIFITYICWYELYCMGVNDVIISYGVPRVMDICKYVVNKKND